MPQIVSASGNSSIYLNGADAPFLTKHRVSEVLLRLPNYYYCQALDFPNYPDVLNYQYATPPYT